MSNFLIICLRFSNIVLTKTITPHLLIKMPFYAVAKGRVPGVFNTWAECESQVKGFGGAKYKKFNSREEALAFTSGSVGGGSRPIAASRVSSVPSRPSRAYSSRSKTSKPLRLAPVSTVVSSKDDEKFDNIDDIQDAIMRKMDQIENDIIGIKEKVLKKNPKKAVMIEPLPVSVSSQGIKRSAEPIEIDSKRKKVDFARGGRSYKFDSDESGYVIVYTDGACSSNGTSGARAGLGVYFGEDHALNVSEPVSGRATNNCGEIQATTKAIQIAHSMGISKLAIHTDSQFVINSVTKWIRGWKRKGWKLATGGPVKNEADFRALDDATQLLDVKWSYVCAHKGILGNERADELAKAGAARYVK